MTVMKKLIIALALLLSAGQAEAGRIFLFAAGADITTITAGCTRIANVDDGYAYTTIRCTDALAGRFEIPAAFPPDAGNSWTFRIHYQTVDDSGSKVCGWSVNTIALTEGSSTQALAYGSSLAVTGTGQVHAYPFQYITPVSAAFGIFNDESGLDCTGTTCRNTRLRAIIELNPTNTTATSCDFDMLEIIY